MTNNTFKNIVLITSVINTSNNPYSYCDVRSVFNSTERLQQTLFTIKSARDKIPDCKIILSECSHLSTDFEDILKNTVDYYCNLKNIKEVYDAVNGKCKALGEICIQKYTLIILKNLNLQFDNLFKISGRYIFSNKFNYQPFDNDKICFRKLTEVEGECAVTMYKIPYKSIKDFYEYLVGDVCKNLTDQIQSYEFIFGKFISMQNEHVLKEFSHIGIKGIIAVHGGLADQ